MANKALAKRQKLGLRSKPSQKNLKPRNPVAIAAKQRAAGPHQKTASSKRQRHKDAIKKRLTELDTDS
jgi:hypothetical protein